MLGQRGCTHAHTLYIVCVCVCVCVCVGVCVEPTLQLTYSFLIKVKLH